MFIETTPPVQLGRSTRRGALVAQLSDAVLVGNGAGGFGAVPALPQLVLARQPASPVSPRALRESALFAPEGLAIR